MKDYKYMVCTRCFTFNHAAYIVDAMNGFAMQETSFPVVTLIVDDASSDGEPDIIQEYLNEHFQRPYRDEETEYAHIFCAIHKTNPNCEFVVFLLKYNHKSIKKDKISYLSEWRDNAKYHALCEGDDYWTDPTKLQSQVAFLEGHKEVSLCFHPVNILGDDIKVNLQKRVGYSSINDLSFGNYIATGSVVCRNDKRIAEYNKMKIKRSRVGDYQTYMFYALIGDLYSLKTTMGVYRVHTENSWRGTNLIDKKQDYDGYLYNLIHIGDMPLFPKLILKIRYLINKHILNEYKASFENSDKSSLPHKNIDRLHFFGSKAKRKLFSLIFYIFKVMVYLKYRFVNIIKK